MVSNLVMTRVDARLVHGQVAARWTKYLDAKRIIIISDEVAADEFMVELFNIAAPVGTKVVVYSQQDAAAAWKDGGFEDMRTIVLFQTIDGARQAHEAGVAYPRLNIGQVPGGEGRRHAVETVSLSEAELDVLLALQADGVEVYFQMLPDSPETPLKKVESKFRG